MTDMRALFDEQGVSCRRVPSSAVGVQLLQIMSISVQQIATCTSLHYMLSNNHVDRLLGCPFLTDCDNGVRESYVTLLNAVADTERRDIAAFLDTQERQEDDMGFLLYAHAPAFGRCKEPIVKRLSRHWR